MFNYVLESPTRKVQLSPNLIWSGDFDLALVCRNLTELYFPDGVRPSLGDPQSVIAHRIADELDLTITQQPPAPQPEEANTYH
jgi:hypothetical protein